MASLFQQQTGPQPPRQVTSAIEIQAILKNLQSARDALHIKFDERSLQFQSFVVQLDEQHLWLDELIPREGDKFMAQGESFRIDSWHDGVHVFWDCSSATCVELEGAPAYRLPLPAELTHHQKRGAFRAGMPPGIQALLTLADSRLKKNVQGRLNDVSATGCRATFEGDLQGLIKPGQELGQSWIALPDGGRLSVTLEARHIKHDVERNTTLLGLAFKKVDAMTQRQIDRFVNFLQREARRFEREDLF